MDQGVSKRWLVAPAEVCQMSPKRRAHNISIVGPDFMDGDGMSIGFSMEMGSCRIPLVSRTMNTKSGSPLHFCASHVLALFLHHSSVTAG